MYLVVAGLSKIDDLNTASYVTVFCDLKPSLVIRNANALINEGLFDNVFVYELQSNSIKLLLASYRCKESGL